MLPQQLLEDVKPPDLMRQNEHATVACTANLEHIPGPTSVQPVLVLSIVTAAASPATPHFLVGISGLCYMGFGKSVMDIGEKNIFEMGLLQTMHNTAPDIQHIIE